MIALVFLLQPATVLLKTLLQLPLLGQTSQILHASRPPLRIIINLRLGCPTPIHIHQLQIGAQLDFVLGVGAQRQVFRVKLLVGTTVPILRIVDLLRRHILVVDFSRIWQDGERQNAGVFLVVVGGVSNQPQVAVGQALLVAHEQPEPFRAVAVRPVFVGTGPARMVGLKQLVQLVLHLGGDRVGFAGRAENNVFLKICSF